MIRLGGLGGLFVYGIGDNLWLTDDLWLEDGLCLQPCIFTRLLLPAIRDSRRIFGRLFTFLELLQALPHHPLSTTPSATQRQPAGTGGSTAHTRSNHPLRSNPSLRNHGKNQDLIGGC